MKFIISNTLNPYRNFAIELYLLKNFFEDYVFVYRNYDSIVIGRNQIRSREINNRFVFENDIPVIRRVSGGGAVFHDSGNINFSFITKRDKFQRFFLLNRIIKKLFPKITNSNINLSDNGIYIDEYKISGFAEYFRGKRKIFHCTLLLNSNLEKLRLSLSNPNYDKYFSSAQISKKSRVVNLSDYCDFFITSDDIYQIIRNKFKLFWSKNYFNSADSEIKKLIIKLKDQNWINKDPNYKINKKAVLNGKQFDINFEVNNNTISNFYSSDKFFSQKYSLNGYYHNYKYIYNKVGNHDITELFF